MTVKMRETIVALKGSNRLFTYPVNGKSGVYEFYNKAEDNKKL